MKRKKFDGFAPVCKHCVLYLYERALRRRIHLVEPLVAIRSLVHDRTAEIKILRASTVAQRMAAGDRLFVAYHNDIPVGYLFAATQECRVGEIDDWLRIEQKEVYFYDAHTGPQFRGKRIYPHLIARAADYFKSESYDYAMIFSTGDNMRSRRGIERSGFNVYQTADYRNLLGWKSWLMETGERHVGSRLRIEN